MNKTARISLYVSILIAIVLVVVTFGFVLADHTVTNADGGTSTFGIINEDTFNIYNISINNSDLNLAVANITQVNITMPSSFTFVIGSNFTDSGVSHTFINESYVLSWEGTGDLVSVNTTNYFVFNASGSTPGEFNFTIQTTNSSVTIYSNISVTINDTTAPSPPVFVAPTPDNATVLDIRDATVNVTFSDNGDIASFNMTLYKDGSATDFVQNNTLSGATFNYILTYSNLEDGNYTVITTVTDSNGQVNVNQTSFTVTAPLIFHGTVKDVSGNLLENALINITVYDVTSDFTPIFSNSSVTNSTGNFVVNISDDGGYDWLYKITLTHTDATVGHVDYVGKPLPTFPSDVLSQVAGLTFYLQPAGTINLTSVNSTGDRVSFNYQVKDRKLGYAVAEEFSDGVTVSEAVVHIPSNRNYSIMIYPDMSMPVSADWVNFSTANSYTFGLGDVSNYNATTRTLNKMFNITMGYSRVYGYVDPNASGLGEWSELTIIPFLLEPGNMVHSSFGALPFNLSAFFDPSSPGDIYNLTTGFYNISLPATVEDSSMMLFAAARNGTEVYGGFNNLSLDSSYVDGEGVGNETYLNFSYMFGMMYEHNVSEFTIFEMDGVGGPGTGLNVTTRHQTFKLINETGDPITSVFAHIETDIDYTDYGVQEFTWMTDVDEGSTSSGASYNILLLNTTGVKEMNVYAGGGPSGEYAPRSVSLTPGQIANTNNITLSGFDPGAVDDNINESLIFMTLYFSNSSCDLPSPDSNCQIVSTEGEENINPFSYIIGGGTLSFRMGVGNISVHYVNVDLLASGPPDALFEANATETAGNDFELALRFGSLGPTIFDYVMVSMPYDDSTAGSGMNESEGINISIPLFYDDDWNIIWDVSTNGTNASALSGNYSEYSAHEIEWQALMSGVQCHNNSVSAADINSTWPCYVDKTTNIVWVRIPHFSGTGPEILGSVLAAPEGGDGGDDGGDDGGSNNNGESTTFWTLTIDHNDGPFVDISPITESLEIAERISINVSGEVHHIGVINMTNTTAIINISSDPVQDVFDIGEVNKYDLLEDGFYDLIVTLNGIEEDKANITINYTHENITIIPTPVCGNGILDGAESCDDNNQVNGDGCSETCIVEEEWSCDSSEPSVCVQLEPPPEPEESILDRAIEAAKNTWWIWVLVLVIIIAWVTYALISKSQEKTFQERVKVKDGKTIKVA